MMKTKFRIIAISFAFILLVFACKKEDDSSTADANNDNNNVVVLTNTEKGVLGTWYYYSGIGNEYRCITFNSDRTACYFEIATLSATATKGNKKCYTDWNVNEEDVVEGTVFDVRVIGDYTGGVYWAGYSINTQNWVLTKKVDNIDLNEHSKISCDFCTN